MKLPSLFSSASAQRPSTSRLEHPLGEIQVQRKAIRHLYLRLDPNNGRLRVNAPHRTSDRMIRDFVSSRADWITRQRQRLADRPAVITADDQLPETLDLLGRPHAVIWHQEHNKIPPCKRLIIMDGRLRLSCRDRATARQLLREHCRQHLKDLLDQRVPAWAEHMQLAQPETRIRRMKTRWGSCNILKRRIWLNLELARLPVEAIDLVIVHELAHLIERGHNHRFYAVMDATYPDWRRWESTLDAYGIIGL
ncbi:MAG TPA: SprT family zinc-dependent metalloprotease [Guyparkeria sp.]|nr:SprT family zinc-dependent metalloprotease [Guyparkeria sp.]